MCSSDLRGGTRALWNLALACDFHGDATAALGHADSVFELNHKLDVYEHLASRRLRRGDAPTAEAYLRRAVEARSEQIAAGEPLALKTVVSLATLLDARGEAAEALAIAEAHLDRVRARLGDDDPLTRELTAIRDRAAAQHEAIPIDR